VINELEVTLTAADKETITASMAAKAAALGVDTPAADIPATMKLGF